MAGEQAIGIDIGGTKIAAGVVDREGRIGRRVERPTPTTSEDDLLAALDAAVEELSAETTIAALGLGLPSTIDQRSGTAVSSVHIPLAGLDVRGRMSERFGVPVGVDNDANAATIAEWRLGAGRGSEHLVMLTLGTGIGGGLILDGRPYRGSVGCAAELGHLVLQLDGPPCGAGCSGRGHFESLVSGTAADGVAREVISADSDAYDLVRLAEEGDARAREGLAGLGAILGAGIGSLVNIFNPEIVVLGGGFAEAGELLFGPAREVVRREALPPGRDLVRIVPAELGSDAGLVGAGLVGFEALDNSP